MAEDHKEETENGLPDTGKLRRFSLGVGVALIIYTLAGGEFGDSVQTVLTPIVHFQRPSALLWALLLASIYSTYRYWYYGIRLALTRSKIREYLCSEESVYVFIGHERFFEEALGQHASQQTVPKDCVARLCRQLPQGLHRGECIVITYGASEPELVQEQVAKKLDKYFPGLTSVNVSVKTPQKGNAWAHVESTNPVTNWWCWLEDFELWLPIIVNGAAVVLCIGREAWPWIAYFIKAI